MNNRLSLLWLALGLVLLSSRSSADTKDLEIKSLRVAALVGESGQAKDGIVRARLDEEVRLFAVVEARLKGKTVFISQAPALKLSGRRISKKRMRRPEAMTGLALKLRWAKVQPVGESYNNTEGGFHWDEIQYSEKALGPWGDDWSRLADGHPIPGSGYADANDGAGTMAFKVSVQHNGKVFNSPGSESRYRGGIADHVTRVAFRRSDDFLGYLSELFNTPYIWGSAGVPPKVHQAERLIGSDCADFIVYGARRAGKNIRYKASYHIPESARSIAQAVGVDAKGQFVDGDKRPLRIGPKAVQVGDVLLFPRHVGALTEDLPPLGILDIHDKMIHTYWAPPRVQPIEDTAYAESKVQVLRYDFD